MSNPWIGHKMCNFVLLYRSPSQSQDEFETFSDNFEMTLKILTIKKCLSNENHRRL